MTSPAAPAKINATIHAQTLSPEQKRFNKLTQTLVQTQTAWIHELGRLLAQKGWNHVSAGVNPPVFGGEGGVCGGRRVRE
jgi:hypothetical protein